MSAEAKVKKSKKAKAQENAAAPSKDDGNKMGERKRKKKEKLSQQTALNLEASAQPPVEEIHQIKGPEKLPKKAKKAKKSSAGPDLPSIDRQVQSRDQEPQMGEQLPRQSKKRRKRAATSDASEEKSGQQTTPDTVQHKPKKQKKANAQQPEEAKLSAGQPTQSQDTPLGVSQDAQEQPVSKSKKIKSSKSGTGGLVKHNEAGSNSTQPAPFKKAKSKDGKVKEGKEKQKKGKDEVTDDTANLQEEVKEKESWKGKAGAGTDFAAIEQEAKKKKKKKQKRSSAEETDQHDKAAHTSDLKEADKVVQEVAVHNAEDAGKAEAKIEAEIAQKEGGELLVSPATTRGGTAAKAFQRVKAEEWLDKRGSRDNSYVGTFGSSGWGAKAQETLGKVRGKDFRHEKTKKKRGSYRGGLIDNRVNSFKFDSDEE